MSALVGQHPEACLESRVGEVLGAAFVRACELAGRRKASDLPVDPLVDSLARQVLDRVTE